MVLANNARTFYLGVKHLKLTVDILASIVYTIIVPREITDSH